MNGQHLSIRLREAGYELALSDDWQKVKVSGSSNLSAPLRAQLKAGREDILCWLKAEALADSLSGRILHLGDVDVPVGYWRFYPDSRNHNPKFSRRIFFRRKNQHKHRKKYYAL